jgi:DNA polymerase-3 subunit alpha
MKFVHLHTHSHYSLLDGLSKLYQLLGRAKELGMDALALTDHGNLYAAIAFYKKAKSMGIKPILGIEAYIAPKNHLEKNLSKSDEKFFHITLLCENLTGWKNLLKLTTIANLHGFYYKPRIDKELLKQYREGLIVLSGCMTSEISRLILSKKFNEAKQIALEYQKIFGPSNFFLEIGYHPNVEGTEEIKNGLIKISKETGIPLVATQDIHYLKPEDAEYQDILLSVGTGNKITDSDRLTMKHDDLSMKSPEEMAEIFKDLPEAIENTVKIAECCNLDLELHKIKLPRFPVPEGETAIGYLQNLIKNKINQRFQEITPEIEYRLNYEIDVIKKTGFADYFLILEDVISWAKERNIAVGPGRGSAAGSLVAYILGITNINPLKYGLFFERFLNPERIQMPDIDIDIADERRDEVFGYLREKYGEDRVANIITFGTMAARAAVRDVGRVLAIDYAFCDTLAKLIPFNQNIDEAIENVSELRNLYETNADAKKILDIAKHFEGVARHASVHACGIVIGNEPLTNYLPLQRSPQDPNMIITQFEMRSIEDLGLIKIDLLGLKNLTIIEKTVRLVDELRNEKIDIAHLPPDDKKTYELLANANTVGVFQLESSGMRRYLKELKPNNLEDITTMISLYRPGPMELIPEYLDRKHGRKPITYLHPKLEPILKNTYGIMIYQEQLMSAVRALANFTLAEADVLRKAVGKKLSKLLAEQKEKFISGCLNNNILKNIADKFWTLIEPFDRYGFNRSHGVSYATIAYQTAYLKAHYPIEFTTSLLNSEAKDNERIAFLVSECQKMGIKILPPNINKSSSIFTPEGKNIRFGLTAIKNVGQNIVNAIIDNRQKEGEFQNLTTFLNRIQHKDLNKKSLESLIKCGALDSLGIKRNQALNNLEEIIKFNSLAKKQQQSNQYSLFSNTFSNNSLKLKPADPASSIEKLSWEKELLGLYVSDHPLNHHREKIKSSGAKPIKEILENNNSHRVKIAGLISNIKKIITKTGKPMLFAKIEDFSNIIEVVVFPDILAKTSIIWKENNILLMVGRLSNRENEQKIICENAIEL